MRLLFYAQREKHAWARSNWWVVFFCVTAALCVAVTYQSPVDLLAMIGTIATVVSFSLSNPSLFRLVTLPSPPYWFFYHFAQRNIGGVLNEFVVISSIAIGFFRHDLPKIKAKRKVQ